MELLELLKARYSVRRFADKPVEEEKLQLVLEAGACAPTAKNQQPQHIYVLESAAALEKIRAITPCAFDAPVVLLICGNRQEGWTNPFNDRNATEMDCSIVTAQMMLEAQSLGLGTTWGLLVRYGGGEKAVCPAGGPRALCPAAAGLCRGRLPSQPDAFQPQAAL